MKFTNKKFIIHFIGIGGIGMSGIAELMHNLGYKVQGSDIGINENIKRLKNKGIKVYLGHNEKNLKNTTSAVYSSAIKKNNIEIVTCKNKSIPLVSRAEMLAELMKNKKSIAVAGSHGKTTTTSLVGSIFDRAKLDPTIINGGIINSYSTNNKFGKGDWLIAEADESDGSFLKLPHLISIITNLDIEHMDYYKTEKNLINAFKNFIFNLPLNGISILCIDNKYLKKISKEIKSRNIFTYSIKDKNADAYVSKISNDKNCTYFKLKLNKNINGNKKLYEFKINLLGNHNVLNCVASIIASFFVGIKIDIIKKSFSNYKGVKRRFTFLGKINNAKIIDDYAHHPTEIKATYLSAKNIYKEKEIAVIFQPHRYTRTFFLMNEFIKVLTKIDKLYILKTYPAGEKKIKGYTSKDLYLNLLNKNKNVFYIENEIKLKKYLHNDTLNKKIIIFMGAGSITKMAHEFVKK